MRNKPKTPKNPKSIPTKPSATKITESSLTPEERAEISRKNGAKSADLQTEAYPKSAPMPKLELSEYDMFADIYSPKCKYAPEMKIYAATCFMLTGDVKGAARMTGLRHQTISEWKNKSEWWPTVLAEVKKDKQDELDAALTRLVHESVSAMQERLEHGEEVVQFKFNKDRGEYDVLRERKEISARDLTSMLNILYDKRAMLRGDPTSISRKADPKDMLTMLKQEFTQIAEEAADRKYNKQVIN